MSGFISRMCSSRKDAKQGTKPQRKKEPHTKTGPLMNELENAGWLMHDESHSSVSKPVPHPGVVNLPVKSAGVYESWLYLLPIPILLTCTLLIIWHEATLAKYSGGYDTPDFLDATVRTGMSSGFNCIVIALGIGSIVWLIALGDWFRSLWIHRSGLRKRAFLLSAGLLAHPWVALYCWDAWLALKGIRKWFW